MASIEKKSSFKVFISTHPFGSVSPEPIEQLEAHNIKLTLNPYFRKIRYEELLEQLPKYDALIAGTEKIDKGILDACPNLKIISRVGIGLDGIDFDEVKKRNIRLTYTPDAVSQAVAELTIGNMLNISRFIPQTHISVINGDWQRKIGFEIFGKTIGIIGFGRVGQRVAKMLQGFSCKILINDIAPDEEIIAKYNGELCSKEHIYKNAEIITLHLPKTPLTANLINEKTLKHMSTKTCLINTSRGGIINESDLYFALKHKTICSAAIDVFEMEPYSGPLCQLENIILTAHSGSCSVEARRAMEKGASDEILRFIQNMPPINPVPEQTIQMERAQRIVPINSDWHEVFSKAPLRKDEKYSVYRKRWGQYPSTYFTANYPLNLDIELVYTPSDQQHYSSNSLLKKSNAKTQFMDLKLIHRILHEVKENPEPMAIKLGYRGDALEHPHFFDIVKLCNEAGIVETLVSTNIESIHEDQIDKFIESKLDVLTIFVTPPKEPTLDILNHSYTNELCHKLNLIQQKRLTSSQQTPNIRLAVPKEHLSPDALQHFKQFWSNWADTISISEQDFALSDSKIPPPNYHWSCSRLWQRMLITWEGQYLFCMHDYLESNALGHLDNMSIKEAWHSKKFQQIRKQHIDNQSHLAKPCNVCTFRSWELSKTLK